MRAWQQHCRECVRIIPASGNRVFRFQVSILGNGCSIFPLCRCPGIPVATVAIDVDKNAAILAAKMLATGDQELLAKIESYTGNLKKQVEAKDAKLQQVGYANY